jgi:hypothetical protein
MARKLTEKVWTLMGSRNENRVGIKFVPALELQSLMATEARTVLAKIILRVASKGGSVVPDLTSLNDFVTNKAFSIFGILLIREQEDRIISFYNSGFGDDMLPVRKKSVALEDGDEFWTVESCRPRRDGGGTSILNPDRQDPWKGVDAEDIQHFQWRFLAQVFKSSTFRYTIREECVLPLTKPGPKRPSEDGSRPYSWVEEWSIHRDYVTFLDPEVCHFEVSVRLY